MWVTRSMFAALCPTCSTSWPVSVTISPSTAAFVPGQRRVVRGYFSPRKFSMTSSSPFTETFIGKWAATTFIFASTPTVRPPARLRTCAAQVLSNDCERFRSAGILRRSVTEPPPTVSSMTSDGNGRSTVPRGPFAANLPGRTTNDTPAGTSMTSRVRSVSVDIGQQPTSDLEFPRFLVRQHATVRGKDEQAEVLGGEEPCLVPFEAVVRNRQSGVDDPAGVDPPREPDVVLPTPARRDERELLDVVVFAEDPQHLGDQLRRRGELDVRLSVPGGVPEGDQRIVQ